MGFHPKSPTPVWNSHSEGGKVTGVSSEPTFTVLFFLFFVLYLPDGSTFLLQVDNAGEIFSHSFIHSFVHLFL